MRKGGYSHQPVAEISLVNWRHCLERLASTLPREPLVCGEGYSKITASTIYLLRKAFALRGCLFKMQRMSYEGPIWILNINTAVLLLLTWVYMSSHTHLLACKFSRLHHPPPSVLSLSGTCLGP